MALTDNAEFWRTVDRVRSAPSGAPLVDATTSTVRQQVKRYADEAAETDDDEG